MSFQLRDYQVEVLAKITDSLSKNRPTVLASSPSSGKTKMALYGVIKSFLKDNQSNVLILTHGQNVLKDQWGVEIEEALTQSEQNRVIYSLPQSFRKKDYPKNIGLVIIDEAHQFTFATMVQDLLKHYKKAKKLYLTGTPSRFIYENHQNPGSYDIHHVAAERLITQGFISEIRFSLTETKSNFSKSDLNANGDTTTEGQQKLEKTAEQDLENVVDEMISTLEQMDLVKKTTYVNTAVRKVGKFQIFNSLKKTMIVCSSIEQAKKVNAHLLSKKIRTVISDSLEDPKSENIQKFIDDKKITVLVVVDRAVLGFNMPELTNVVDLSGSHNIDRIYQLYARVMRQNGDDCFKYFYKLTPYNQSRYTELIFNAALCMIMEKFIKFYNGKNLNEMELPVIVEKQRKKSGKKTGTNSSKSQKALVKVIKLPTELQNFVEGNKFLINICNKRPDDNNILNEVAFVKISIIKEKLEKQASGNLESIIDTSDIDSTNKSIFFSFDHLIPKNLIKEFNSIYEE